MSQDTNYALISALYSSKTGGLYSDVYFPIIKYTIVQLFNQKRSVDSAPYYMAEDVHDFIWEKFKIHIPNIVITKSLQKIDKINKDFVELILLENGNSFQIRKLWDAGEFDRLAEREAHFSEGLKKIEEDYKAFLVQHGTYDDGVSYLQFIADNAEEVLGYFQNSDASIIDEKYTTIIFFWNTCMIRQRNKMSFVLQTNFSGRLLLPVIYEARNRLLMQQKMAPIRSFS